MNLLNKIIRQVLNADGAASIDDSVVIKNFTKNPDFPYLVSFSRTGSHWLRMIMELYFEKPALVRAFYFRDANDFTCYHTHDMELKLKRENVIYLHRNPVETVYSQLSYYKEGKDDETRRKHWTNLYARHLVKWLIQEDFTKKKTIVTYDGMVMNMSKEFAKICLHFGAVLDESKLSFVLEKISKSELKNKTKYDPQVVNLSSSYQNGRELFKEKYGGIIYEEIIAFDSRLVSFLPSQIEKINN